MSLAGSLGEQEQGVEQLNTNLQGGAAFALSDASGVDVYSDKVSAGGIGITASSSVDSSARLGQSVDQTNRNSAAISFPPVGVQTPNNTTNPLEVGIQSEDVEQVNLNAQLGVSAATSFSDYVNVQAGEVAAGGDGIVAASNAVSNAELRQSAEQTNEDSKSITRRPRTSAPGATEVLQNPVGIGVQTETVLQANASLQVGAAISTSKSGPVTVTATPAPVVTLASEEHDKGKSKDTIDAVGDGVIASSTAEAQAGGIQSAVQLNDNKADANAALALQLQEIGQINFSGQGGASIATALSDSVLVDQGEGLKSGGDGIAATSSATSEVGLSQSADQTNRNSAVATLDRADIDFDIDLGDSEDDIAIDLLGSVGAQVQLVGQANINLQGGLGVATSIAGPVTVYSDRVTAGDDGVYASSAARSAVNLDQSANQTNVNSALITLPARPLVPETTEFPTIPTEIAAQLEGVLQVNLNGQFGAAVATSVANEVYVQSTDVTAATDGITAISSATSSALLEQSAIQSNKDTKTIARVPSGGPSPDQVQVQSSTTALQLEAILQANANGQFGAAAATSELWPSVGCERRCACVAVF